MKVWDIYLQAYDQHLFSRVIDQREDLAYAVELQTQLRDSAGFSPASSG